MDPGRKDARCGTAFKGPIAVLLEGISLLGAALRFGIDRWDACKGRWAFSPAGIPSGQPRARPKLDAHAAFFDEILKSDLSLPKEICAEVGDA